MQEQKRRIPVGLLVGLSTVVVAAGSATAYFAWQQSHKSTPAPTTTSSTDRNAAGSEQSPPSPSASPLPSTGAVPYTVNRSEPKVAAPSSAKTPEVYWLQDRGAEIQLAAAPIKVNASDRPEAALTTAMNTVLGAPSGAGVSTAIPQGTQLRSLKVKPDGIHVDLSKTFTAGGGSLSMSTRLAQVLYTATSLDPKAPVFLSVEGKPLETLGGEGLMIDQPLTRAMFEQGAGQKGE